MISLGELGWRTNEPEDHRLLAGEEPALLRQAVDIADSSGLSINSLAERFALPVQPVRTFVGIP